MKLKKKLNNMKSLIRNLINWAFSGEKLGFTNPTQNSGGNYRITSPSSYPYTVLSTDEVILVNTAGSAKTINLPALAITQDGFKIKICDHAGSATANNVTIDGAGTELIDGLQTRLINNAWGSIDLVKTPTRWKVV